MRKIILLIGVVMFLLVGCSKSGNTENVGIPLSTELVKEMSKTACKIGCLNLMEELIKKIEVNDTVFINTIQKCEIKCNLHNWR